MPSRKPHDDREGFKYARIKTELSIQILEGQLRPHDRFPSLSDISHKYKVSEITARRVLNDLVKEGLVYASRGRGSFVSDRAGQSPPAKAPLRNKGKVLGVVFEHAAGFFMSELIKGIDEEAFAEHAQISLCLSNNSYEREAENLERLAGQGVDRILLFMVLRPDDKALNPNIPLYLRLQSQGVKILLLGCHLPGLPIPSITWDDADAYRRLIGAIREKGGRRLVYVMRFDNASTTTERLQGVKEGLLEQNLPFNPSRVVVIQCPNVDLISLHAARQFGEYLDKDEELDAIVCSDEMVAAGVVEALDTKWPARGKPRPLLGGMACMKNLHVLRGHPFILLEGDSHQMGHEAVALMLSGNLPGSGAGDGVTYRRILPMPLRPPRGPQGTRMKDEG